MKRCTVVYATAARQWSWRLELPDQASVDDALRAAREQSREAAVPWDADVGIFGELCTRAAVPRDGDRIEIYRPLTLDPKESRRARAAAGKAAADPASARPRASDPKPVR
jgi:putative ubiquitin-RnfH superfamily antitoxin RatB of RatAB toxin-antitoxin module